MCFVEAGTSALKTCCGYVLYLDDEDRASH